MTPKVSSAGTNEMIGASVNLVGHRRRRLFLQKVLQAVGGRLQQSLRAHAIGTQAVLHPGTDAPLEQREQRHAHHQQVEDEKDLDGR
jgi:hypothetical protein